MARRRKFADQINGTIAEPQPRPSVTQPPSKPAGSRVVPDWRAYFLESFVPQHGGEPVDDGARLIFRDGWAYSRMDYRGPEYPPPKAEAEAKAVRLRYWTLRRGMVAHAKDVLFESVRVMAESAAQRSAPMMRQSIGLDDLGRPVRQGAQVDFQMLEIEMEQAVRAVDECDRQIRLLTAETIL